MLMFNTQKCEQMIRSNSQQRSKHSDTLAFPLILAFSLGAKELRKGLWIFTQREGIFQIIGNARVYKRNLATRYLVAGHRDVGKRNLNALYLNIVHILKHTSAAQVFSCINNGI